MDDLKRRPSPPRRAPDSDHLKGCPQIGAFEMHGNGGETGVGGAEASLQIANWPRRMSFEREFAQSVGAIPMLHSMRRSGERRLESMNLSAPNGARGKIISSSIAIAPASDSADLLTVPRGVDRRMGWRPAWTLNTTSVRIAMDGVALVRLKHEARPDGRRRDSQQDVISSPALVSQVSTST
jgi:hypothetical protein